MAKKRVLVTGAKGVIASKVIPELKSYYDLILLDIQDMSDQKTDRVDTVVADLLDRNRDAYREYFSDVDAVIHSGFVKKRDGEEAFWAELDNVKMAYNVYQTCVEESVPRLVVISSNHAADFYEQHILSGKLLSIGPDTYPLSDNYYGWAKVAYEALGFAFAVGKLNDGNRLENVQIRIGAPREADINGCKPGDTRKLHRDLGAYLSLRDEVQLLVKSIETPDIKNEFDVPFQVFYGISGNTFNFWSIENAKRVLGYRPEDDSVAHFSEKVAAILGIKKEEPPQK